MCEAAAARSASAQTMAASFPPSSICAAKFVGMGRGGQLRSWRSAGGPDLPCSLHLQLTKLPHGRAWPAKGSSAPPSYMQQQFCACLDGNHAGLARNVNAGVAACRPVRRPWQHSVRRRWWHAGQPQRAMLPVGGQSKAALAHPKHANACHGCIGRATAAGALDPSPVKEIALTRGWVVR